MNVKKSDIQLERLEQIWRDLNQRLRQFVRSRGISSSDSDDILQTVFLKIHQNIDTVRNLERLESWVFQITRNAVTDHLRKRRDLPTYNQDVFQDDLPSATSLTAPDADANANLEIASCLAAMIELLPDEQKTAVKAYELEGVSQAEIANRESISLSGAKSRIQRGRKQLAAMMRQCCEFDLDARGNVVDYTAHKNACSSSCDCAPDVNQSS